MSNRLPTQYQQFIHKSRYSRWLPEEKRRETWDETVDRYFDFFVEHLRENHEYEVPAKDLVELKDAVLNLEIMPSMRALMSAGPALKRDHAAGYNCSYFAIDRMQAFDEILYVLMCGVGAGFSVERQHVNKLPSIPDQFHDTDTNILVADSKIGWAKALRELIGLLYQGQVPTWDVSRVRPAGAPLKTFGGRSSGPEPLVDVFRFTVRTFKNAAGRQLNSVECHDLVCKIADCVIVGGVRRSALISLSNLSDDRMRHAKSGQWWETNPHRALSNNSAAYTEKPDIGIFMDEWKALYESKSGERGIFNRRAAKKHMERFGRRDPNHEHGTNPCGEIVLRDRQFCNLTEVVVRPSDTPETLERKVRLATTLGTWQATLTNFRYLSKKWRENCEEEALLGVSLTGIMDNTLLNTIWEDESYLSGILMSLRETAVGTNEKLAKKLKINASVAITTGKPSGTVSQLVDCASGIHPRHSEYYIRTVRADKKDPLSKFMIDSGFPVEDDVMNPSHINVFSFPMKSPDKAVTRNDDGAINQLKRWLIYRTHWCEHNQSITITVRENEWLDVAAWVYRHFDDIGGVSFLPHSDHSYRQAPYQECTREEYEELAARMPKDIDWREFDKYEDRDNTESSQTMACVAGACEIVDL